MFYVTALLRFWLRRSTGGLPLPARRRHRGAVTPRSALKTEELEPRLVLSSNGVYDLIGVDASIPQAALTNPNVDGIALRSSWNSVEPADGVYDWTYLDSQIAAAANAGKKVALGVAAGTATPAWVYAEGASAFPYIDDTSPQTQTIPVPWDPVFLAKWEAFVGALGNRYASNPAVVRVDISGINTTTRETKLPKSQGEVVSNALGTWTTTNDVANWLSLGYTRQRVESAWQGIADTFSQAFPQTLLDIKVITYGTPPIDNAGNVIPGASADPQLVADLINTGIARYGAHFIVQNNGLSDTYVNSQVTAVANQATTGYQMLWYVTNDPTYRMNNGVPVDIQTELQTAVNKGIAGGGKFLEIYDADITNPALQAVIADAHTRLLNGLTPTANRAFVIQLYQDLLQRGADATGLAFWSGLLDQGVAPAQVVLDIEGSTEYQTDVVESLYSQLLHRSADPDGLTAWVNFLAQGATTEQLEARLMGSDEYFATRGGGTNTGFLQAVYQDALNRGLDPAGAQGWGQELAQGVSRGQVAAAVLTSVEYQQDLVQGYYQRFLHRAADPSGLDTFVSALARGTRDEDIVAAIVGSAEYLGNLQRSPPRR